MVLSPRCTVLLTAILGLLTAARAAALPQGSTREDRASVAGLDAFTAGAQLDELPRSVDLRPLLPSVGLQTMNDCAAWAFGYAGRTYLEALDQGWKPDSPERIFSPTFIYNQVNQGVDGGSRIDRVLDLLLKQEPQRSRPRRTSRRTSRPSHRPRPPPRPRSFASPASACCRADPTSAPRSPKDTS